MTTFDTLTTEIVQELLGWTRDQEQVTSLSAGITAADTTIPVADASRTSRGLAEIDDELLWFNSFDSTNNTATAAPFGRGYQGTTAAAHTSGTKVTYNPRFPRSVVKRAVNEVINAVGDQLWTVATTTFPKVAAVTTYDLPAGTLQVQAVSWQVIGPSQYWMPVKAWRLNHHADTTAFADGKSLDVWDPITPGRTVQVVYTKACSELSNGTDDLTTVGGVPASAKDVIKYGAMAKLVVATEAARLDNNAVEADALDQPVPMGSGGNLSRYFMQLHLQGLQREVERLQRTNPVTVHRLI